ncbi:DUF4142 domain-containing protein [Skermanella pratensis]|uniref:DUF4142 domain-containing protein n=1 Tax=Skermanella pratensis TaxID=2233999 RepID=UPI001300F536|nr:DUF4142 domain-containing protein [Skermanella pratensis]
MGTRIPALTVSVFLAMGVSLAHGQTPVTTRADSPPISDPKFVEQATAAGLAEVEVSKIAAQKATSPDVKAFAQEMVRDHETANAELKKIAEASGFPTEGSKGSPPTTGEQGAALQPAQSLETLSGAEFDREYMVMQVKDHDDAVKLYEAQAANSQDDELRGFATAQLPALKRHLERARAIADPLIGSEAATGTTGTK